MRDQLVKLGKRIKAIRKEKKITLQTLAEQTGLTAGLISKIENFRTLPSLPVLVTIAGALKIDLAELFAGMNFEDKPHYLLVRKDEQEELEREDSPGMRYSLILESALKAVNIQVMLVTVEPGVKRDAVSGIGDELIYMLSGELAYRIGDDRVKLAPGDTLFFDGTIPHSPIHDGNTPVTLLVCYFLKDNNL